MGVTADGWKWTGDEEDMQGSDWVRSGSLGQGEVAVSMKVCSL